MPDTLVVRFTAARLYFLGSKVCRRRRRYLASTPSRATLADTATTTI